MEEPSWGWRAWHLAPGLRQWPAADFPAGRREAEGSGGRHGQEAAVERGASGRRAATYWRGGRTGVEATVAHSVELQPETRLAAWKALQEAEEEPQGHAANLLSPLPPWAHPPSFSHFIFSLQHPLAPGPPA